MKEYILLHIVILGYSVSGVLGKLASAQRFPSIRFLALYGGSLACLGLYAFVWQQIIKRLPLTTAFANKAVTVVWGMVWGVLIFREPVTMGQLMGVILVVVGVVLFAKADDQGAPA